VVIIQVYTPTSDYSDDDDVEDMYEKTEDILNTATKSKEYILIMEEWNAAVSEGKEVRYMAKDNW